MLMSGVAAPAFALAVRGHVDYQRLMRYGASCVAWMITCVALGCSDSGITESASPITALELQPEALLQELQCARGEDVADGEVLRYVVTLEDLGPLPAQETSDEGAAQPKPFIPYELPYSPPTGCRSGVRFQSVVHGHRYVALVDLYSSAVIPVTEGGRSMVDTEGAPVEPSYRVRCGGQSVPLDGGTAPFSEQYAGPVTAQYQDIRRFESCEQLQ